jgi:hypothetical protein
MGNNETTAITTVWDDSYCLIILSTPFDEGFYYGFKAGYCYQKFNCISPIPSIAPMPNINESFDSYSDGYNKGFIVGLARQ